MKYLLLLVLLCTCLAGCGYRQANTYETPEAVRQAQRYPVRTVHIAAFENAAGVAGAEETLAERLRELVQSETPYKLADAASAESVVRGRIASARGADGKGQASTTQTAERYTIDFEWRDLWHDKNLIDRRTIEVASLSDAARAITDTMYVSGAVRTPARGRDGYAWHSLYREDVRTVAVPIFTNRSYTRGMEFQLTKSITNYLESSTPYKVASQDSADTVLEGEIVSVTGNMISADVRSALPQEEMVTVVVNFVWKDLRSGRILVERRGFRQSTMYYPTLGESAYVGKQSGAERLAMAIVNELQAEW